MYLTRDKTSAGLICVWTDVERKDLSMGSVGIWAADKAIPRIMEISAKDYKKVFEGGIPKKGSICEIGKLEIRKLFTGVLYV